MRSGSWAVLPQADATLRTDPAPGQDSPAGLSASAAGRQDGKGPSTFDFLGFTLYWRRTLRGRWRMGCKTRRARLHRAMNAVYEWCRSHRHLPLVVQHAGLRSRLQGHFNYFGVNGNLESVACLLPPRRTGVAQVAESSQPAGVLTWERFLELSPGLPSPPSSGHGADLGAKCSARRKPRKSRMVAISSSGSERAPAGQPAGATRQFGRHPSGVR